MRNEINKRIKNSFQLRAYKRKEDTQVLNLIKVFSYLLDNVKR